MSEKLYHYVYQITNMTTNRKYIGKRSSKISPINDLGKKYFSSSSDKDFITEQKSNPPNFKYEILREFDTVTFAVAYEVELHNQYDVGINPVFYNKAKQTSSSFDPTGRVPVKDKDGNNFLVDKTDHRYLSGELVHVMTGKVTVKDKDGNNFLVDKTDPRYLSGNFVPVNTGLVAVKDKDGNNFLVDKTDPRYLSGELIHVTKGRPMDDYTRARVSETQSGSGNSQYGTCWIHNTELKKCKKIKKDDPVPEGWIVGRKMRFD